MQFHDGLEIRCKLWLFEATGHNRGQNEFAGAEKEFREALRLSPSADNHYSLAACLMSMDRYDEALSELETASRIDPGQTLYRARREELLKLMKQTNR